MRNLFSSFLPPITQSQKPQKSMTLRECYEAIKSDGGLKSKTELVQRYKDPEAFRHKKVELLPFVRPAGVFSGCHDDDLVSWSGFMPLDVDKLGSAEEAAALRDKMSADDMFGDETLFFVSPSGKGVKGVVRWMPWIPDADGGNAWSGSWDKAEERAKMKAAYREAFEMLVTYVEAVYGIPVDVSGKNIGRAMLLCHDEGACFKTGEAMEK